MPRGRELVKVLQGVKNWDDIYGELHAINGTSPELAGKVFEQFCRLYYLIEPSVAREYSEVWLFTDVPGDIRQALNLNVTDRGVDLVLQGHDGRLSAVQCKFKSDQASTICWNKDRLANLLAEGKSADQLIVFTNASALDRHALTKEAGRLKFVGYGDLVALDEHIIHNMRSRLQGGKPDRAQKRPKLHQKHAIEKVLAGLIKHDRGQLILPCGAGKTLTALWIKEALVSSRTLVLFPSLALLRQTKKEWAENAQMHTPYISVCSENDINSESCDEIHTHISDIPGPVSTSPASHRQIRCGGVPSVVLSKVL